jgi:AraC-like DNA-binding protein
MRSGRASFFVFLSYLLILANISIECSTVYSQKKINFRIIKIPEYSPVNDTLYLSCSFNDWKLKDETLRFTKLEDGSYFLSAFIPENQDFEYKVNRGSWETVEGNDVGEYLANRNFISSAGTFDINIVVESWQDLHKKFLSAVDVYVTSVPSTTPKDAKLYITGTFNNWNQSDPASELVLRKDGNYHGVIKPGLEAFEFKITRGSWEAVEGRWDGGFKSNRFYKVKLGEKNNIEINIASWEDLSVWPYWKMFLFFVFIIQAVQLSLIIQYSKYNKLLLVLAIMLLLGFFIRLVYNYRELYNAIPLGYLLPACIYSFITPWFFNWLNNTFLIDKNSKKSKRINWSFWLPFFSIVIGVTAISMTELDFMEASISVQLDIYFLLRYAFAIGLNLVYGKRLLELIRTHNKEIPEWAKKISRVFHVNWIIALGIVILMSLTKFLNLEANFITEWTENLLWLSLGITVIYIEWVVLRYSRNAAVNEDNRSHNFAETENWNVLKPKLTKLMDEDNLYTNSKITLTDLANYLGTNTFYVSKLLNEGFGKSFSDYINSYRIEAFIKAVKNKPGDGDTYLSIAYNVGFNSKSSFNRAFKKYTGFTPSEYFSY